MDILNALVVFNYALVAIYGLLLSAHFAGGWKTRAQKYLVFALCPLLLLLQAFCWLYWGLSVTMQAYPLIVHLPVVLVLVFVLKKPVGVSVVSVMVAYLCCQFPRWVRLVFASLVGPFAGEISYTLAAVLFYFFLYRYFARTAHDAMTFSTQNLFFSGCLPCVYYVFEYAILIGANVLPERTPALDEFFSTLLCAFYVAFLVDSHKQMQKRMQAELQKSVLEVGLKQSYVQLESLQRMETQTAIHRHDMRHHLSTIDTLLSKENTQQARNYIKEVQSNITSVTIKHFCENDLVNLLCSSFANRAERDGIHLTVDAKLPKEPFIADTELCAIISNGLENALHAVSALEKSLKRVEFYCAMRESKLLIEIKNPYEGEILMRDGLPVSGRKDHGYGCRSIRAIVEQNKGICIFEAKHGVFLLRVVLPLHTE